MNATVVQLPTVESLSEEIRGLVYERQTLRSVGASHEEQAQKTREAVHANATPS